MAACRRRTVRRDLRRFPLRPDGALALDAPDGACEHPLSDWPTYYSTLRAAGFPRVMPMVTRIDAEAPVLQQRVAWLAERIDAQEFIVAFPRDHDPVTTWWDPRVPLDALRAAHLSPSLRDRCTCTFQPERVNSIFRPTLPALELLSVSYR